MSGPSRGKERAGLPWLNRWCAGADPTTAIEAAFRIEFPRVVGALVRVTGSIDLAEELAQDALVDAAAPVAVWRVPANPGAWLTAVARRKAIDRFRRDRTRAGKYAQIGRSLQRVAPQGRRTVHPTRR